MLFDLEGFEYPAAMADDLSPRRRETEKEEDVDVFPETLLGLSLSRRGPNVSFI